MATTSLTSTTLQQQQHRHHQHNRSHHLHPRHHLLRQRAVAHEGMDGAPQGPQMHVHPALRTPFHDGDGDERGGVVGVASGKAKNDLSLFPREAKVRRKGTGTGTGTGKAGQGAVATSSRRAAKDGAWSCAVMKEMGI